MDILPIDQFGIEITDVNGATLLAVKHSGESGHATLNALKRFVGLITALPNLTALRSITSDNISSLEVRFFLDQGRAKYAIYDITASGPNTITQVSPNDNPNTGRWIICNCDGGSGDGGGSLPLPIINSINPTTVTNAFTAVTITGENLANATSLEIPGPDGQLREITLTMNTATEVTFFISDIFIYPPIPTTGPVRVTTALGSVESEEDITIINIPPL